MLLRGGEGVKCTCDSGLPAGLSGAQRGGGGGGGGRGGGAHASCSVFIHEGAKKLKVFTLEQNVLPRFQASLC